MNKLELYTQQLKTIIDKCESFVEFEKTLINTKDEKHKGNMFEIFSYYLFKFHPNYDFDNLYMYDCIPIEIKNKLGLPDIDKGVDILASSKEKYYVIQCKFRSNKKIIINWSNLATYLASGFVTNVDKCILITNGNEVCKEIKGNPNCVNIYGSAFWENISEVFSKIKNHINGINTCTNIITYVPFDYQNEIINVTCDYFSKNNNGKLVLPCGTGKTLTTYFCMQKLGYKKIIVIVPSLLLLSQTYHLWKSQKNSNYLIIGTSSNSIHNENNIGLMCESDQKIIENIIVKYDDLIIFATYCSSFKIKNALSNLKIFYDICIYDEAHRTVGSDDKSFSITLTNNFNVHKKIFLTATPKICISMHNKVLTMNDENMYGNVIYHLKLSDAITKNLLCDYTVVTTNVEDLHDTPNVATLICQFGNIYDTETILSALFIIKCIKHFKLKKILTYHYSIKESKNFSILLKHLS